MINAFSLGSLSRRRDPDVRREACTYHQCLASGRKAAGEPAPRRVIFVVKQ
jgi:hypothetical protein